MHRNAFSLFELLLVLGLLVLLASVSLPTLRSWQLRIELDQARNALVDLISEGVRRAASEGNAWEIHLEKSPSSLVLKRQVDHRSKPSKIDPHDKRDLPRSIQLEFIRLGSDQRLNSLTINSLGQVTLSRISLTQNGRPVQTYAVDRLTSDIVPISSAQ